MESKDNLEMMQKITDKMDELIAAAHDSKFATKVRLDHSLWAIQDIANYLLKVIQDRYSKT